MATPLRALAVGVVMIAGAACGATPRVSVPQQSRSVAKGTSAGTGGIFYVEPKGDQHTLNVFDWNGRLIRTIHPGVPVECCDFEQSPDGSRLLAGARVLDSTGADLGGLPNTIGMPKWADDNEHLCAVRPIGSPPEAGGELVELDSRGNSRPVTTTVGEGAHGGPTVVVCSVRDDRVVVFDTFAGSTSQVLVYRLSDGARMSETASPGDGSFQLPCSRAEVISGDGRLVAWGATNRGSICERATGKVLGNIAGEPQALSWDGSLVVESLYPIGPNPPVAHVTGEVVEWRTGRVLWTTAPAGTGPEPMVAPITALSEPANGGAIALTYVREIGPAPEPSAEVWLVPAHGSPRLLASAATPAVL